MLHTQFAKDCSLWSPRAQQTHSERARQIIRMILPKVGTNMSSIYMCNPCP